MVEAHQGCVFAVLLPSLFFLLVAWQGKGQRREHERNESACVHLFGKLCNTSWRPNIWLPATSWPTSPHHHHPSHTHFLAGSPYQAHGCLRAFAPAHSFGRTHFPCTSAKFTAWLQQGLSSDTCSLGRLVFPNCPFLKQPFLSLSTPSFCFFFFPSPNIHHYLTWHYIPILCFFIEWTQYHTGNSDGESPAWVWEDIYEFTRRLKCIAWLRTTGLMEIIVFGVRRSGLKFQLGKQDPTTVAPMRSEKHGSDDPQHQGLYQDHTRTRFRTTSWTGKCD